MQKAKWLSEEALQVAVKRREAKSKGEKESYKHLNAEFQRIARRCGTDAQWSITQPLKRIHLISSNEVDETGAYYTK